MTIARELETARQSLLDLTLRNRLLNHRPSATRTVRVTGELPAEIYDALVLREKILECRGTGARKRVDDAVAVQRNAEVWSARGEGELDARHTDRWLQTPYDDESLAKKLFRVYHEGRTAVEEQGYTVTHLAIGFLEWFESADSDQPRRAPLILVPVELERVRAGDFSKVKWTGEDVFSNISLVAKMAELGIVLPPFDAPEDKSGIDVWLQSVADAIARKPRWRVLSELTIDFFSFTKFVMYKDLDPSTWPDGRKPEDHPLLRTLFHPSGDTSEPGFDEATIDDKLTARDLWQVMDADPSQIAVVEDVKSGRNLVVQGPPGTGKSQTITNLIAETLAAGKTVLFVSEKMAALEVVKSRLDGSGLGPFCLELHSRKANKKSVLLELQRSLGTKAPAIAGELLLDEHELLKQELNRYASAIGTPAGNLGMTPFQLFGMRQAALARLDGTSPSELPRIPDVFSVSATDHAAAESALRDLAYAIPLVHPAAQHPWRASSRDAMLPHHEEQLRSLLHAAREAVQRAVDAATALAEIAGVRPPSRLDDVLRAQRAAEIVARAGAPVETAVLLSAAWNAPNAEAERLLESVDSLQRQRAELGQTFTESALEGSNDLEVEELGRRAGKFFRFLDGRYRVLRRELGGAFIGSAPKPPQMLAELSRLVEHQGMRDALRGDVRGRGFFGVRWRADKSDTGALRAFAQWVISFRRELLDEALSRRAVDVAALRVDSDVIRAASDRLGVAETALREALSNVLDDLRVEERLAFGSLIGGIDFGSTVSMLDQWEQQIGELFRWSQFNAARRAISATAAAPLEPLVVQDRIPPDMLLPFYRASLAESLLRVAFGERAPLGTFAGELHERKIARFRELDRNLVLLNRARLSRRLHAARPQIGGGASPRSEAGILLGELNRRRGHMPIRKLLSAAGGLIQRIKPCFLMSPLSIAQFLDPRSARFDLIVFDEASQVRPEDAIGAFLRGTQIVVMGDTQQLPPTSFFDHLASGDAQDPDDDEEEVPAGAALTDVESILHQCARSYPSKTLTGHYRSRHESLIAISNVYFYENKLRIYPSPVDRAEDVGLHFVHVPRGVYDRGGSSTNRIEAQVVASAAIDHYRRFPGKSLGVGTFNIKQQECILEEVEALLRANSEMEPHFKSDRRERFFVKNLETIQGDERDVILISIGYGRDSTGKLALSFGPINKLGGERRLNVLISRAREKCVVFSNFTAADLPVDGETKRGVVALKAFLEYAQTRRLMTDQRADDDDESPFEDAVAEVLRGEGFEVRQRVGCAGFRLDLAVVDPNEHGRYLLGIECDGAQYYSSRVARDRDRLRQQVLENLGWRIHRIWSTDWYRNRAQTVARLLQAVENAKSEPMDVAPPPIVVAVEEQPPAAEVELPPAAIAEAPEYESCRALRIPIAGELHLAGASFLAVAVEDVVAVEGPVHIDEVVRRIRTLWGLQRAGNRIREAIDGGVRIAVAQRRIEADGEFLRVPDAAIVVRRRNGDPPARIDLISNAELSVALLEVLRAQFATNREELVSAAARRVGIQATSDAVAERIGAMIDAAVERGDLRQDGELVRASSF